MVRTFQKNTIRVYSIISKIFLSIFLILNSLEGFAQNIESAATSTSTSSSSSSDDRLHQLCLDAFHEGVSLGCPEAQTEDINLEREPGIEEHYLETAKKNLRGESFIFLAANSATSILSIFLVGLVSNRFNPAGAGVGGVNMMMGAGAIGIAQVFSTQVNEFFRTLTQPVTQHVVFPLIKKLSEIFGGTIIAFRDPPYIVGLSPEKKEKKFSFEYETNLPTITLGDLTEKAYGIFQYLFDINGSKKDLWHPREMLEARRVKFLAIKDRLPPAYQDAIIDQLTILQRQYDSELFSKGNSLNVNVVGENERIEAQKKFSKIDRIMNLPVTPKQIVKEKHQKEIDNLLAPYSPEIKDKIDIIVENIVSRSTSTNTPASSNAAKPKSRKRGCEQARPIFYLLGAPGTGKTYLVDELGKILKLPVIKIKLNPNTNEFDLIGAPTNRYESGGELGILTKAFSALQPDLNFNNAIIFIDEADKVLNKEQDSSSGSYSSSGPISRPLKTFLLDLFERNPKPLRFNSLGVSLDISRITFVLAGNAPVIGKSNEFMQRMNQINFGAFSLEKRMGIACTQFGRSQSNYGHDTPSLASLLAPIVAMSRADDDRNLGIKNLLKTLDNYTLYLKKSESENFDLSKNPFDWKKALKDNSLRSSDILSEIALFKKNFEKKKQRLQLPENHSLLNTLENEKDYFETVSLSKAFTGDKPTETIAKRDMHRLHDLLRLPMGIKNLAADTELEARIDKILDLYPEHVRKAILPILESHITNSEDTNFDTDVNKNVLYFVGEPGTLKTSLVRALAEAMGLPIIEISLEKMSEKTKGMGKYYQSEAPSEPIYSEFTKVFLAQDDKVPFPENAIILIDEADRTLNGQNNGELVSQILKMLDRSPHRRDLSIEGLGNREGSPVTIDASRFLFILTGNNLINDVQGEDKLGAHDSKKSAINDRFNAVVKFENFELHGKKEVAKSMFTKFSTGQKIFTKLDEKALKAHLDFMEVFADFYHELGTISFRPLENTINLYVAQLKRKRDFSQPLKSFDYQTALQQSEVLVKTEKKKKPKAAVMSDFFQFPPDE